MGRAMNEWAQHVEMQITIWMSIINIGTNMTIRKKALFEDRFDNAVEENEITVKYSKRQKL